MDVSAMITVINNHGFEDTDSTQKLADINDAIFDINARFKWPWLTKTTNLAFDGTNPYPTNIPADFKAVKWLSDTTTGTSLYPERLSTIRDKFGAALTQGDPTYFYFVGSQLRFYPVPPTSTTRFLLDYRATQPIVTDTTLEAAILIPPQYHRLVVVGALARLYAMDDDPELSATKQQEFEARLESIRSDAFSQQDVSPDHVYMLDEDEIDYGITPYWIP